MPQLKNILYKVTIIWYILLFIITYMLVSEYNYFKQQAKFIERAKDDYTISVLTLQRAISELEVIENKDNLKKKIDNNIISDSLEEFILVNRDYQYLKKATFDFARKHDLYDSVKEMYDCTDQSINGSLGASYDKLYIKPFIKTSNNKKKENSLKHCNRWRKLQKNPILRWPLNKSTFWISSTFGPRKKVNGAWGFHNGVDMAALKGTKVYAADSGKVIKACFMKGYGNTIIIKHNKVFKTRYAHLNTILVKSGDLVKRGDIIGKVGDTGLIRKKGNDGSHLHFEVYYHNKRSNPFYFLE